MDSRLNAQDQKEGKKDKSFSDSPVVIGIYRPVYKALKAYAKSNEKSQVGGIILGRYGADENNPQSPFQAILVKGEINANISEAASKKKRLIFTQENWSQMEAQQKEEFPGLQIVGWFRSQPGRGAIPFPDDIPMHQNFFALPWQIAYIIDPVKNTDGFFILRQGKFLPCEFKVVENPSLTNKITFSVVDEDIPEDAPISKKKKVFSGLAAAALFLAIVAGIFFYRDNAREREYNAQVVFLQNQISTLQEKALQEETTSKAEVQKTPPAVKIEVPDIKYTVRPGDTMAGISMSFYGTTSQVAQIAAYNNITNPALIRVGQVIYIKR